MSRRYSGPPFRTTIRALCVLVVGCTSAATAQLPPDTVLHQIDTVRVEIGRLRAGGVPLARLPYPAQVIAPEVVGRTGATSLPELLDGVVGVSSASQFGSEVQQDLRLRGFQVGPVVGFPQSVSVFVDGVRVNEPDASQVNFDLIPMDAVERVEVIRAPGGPFGRNTLAGAINLVTRRGATAGEPRGSVGASGGSFSTTDARGWVGGGLVRGVDYLVSARHHRSEGWRELGRTHLSQLFGKVGYRGAGTDAWLSYTFGDNYVEGPGSLPSSWLAGDLPPELSDTPDPRRLQFTGFDGDRFEPRLHFLVASLTRSLGASTSLQANGFLRSNDFAQFNDNITEANVRGETDILSAGGTLQAVHSGTGGATWTGGVEYSRNRTGILIFEVANPAFPEAGGLTENVSSSEDNLGAFAHLWIPATGRTSVSASLRYDHVVLPITDHLDPENSGRNRFDQLTGSLGADLVLTTRLRAYASYGRGFRAPVILEISCADPEDPCPLPFELGADPPLDPVITDTWQAGVRLLGRGASMIELAAYWAEVYDDLFAVVVPPSTRGYFKNLDRTRRQGVELAGRVGLAKELEIRSNVAITRATFQSPATLASALLDDDEDADGTLPDDDLEEVEGGGAVVVGAGDSFAMVPGVTAALGAAYTPGDWRWELEGSFVGSQHFLGDENNVEEFGRLPAYAVLSGTVERSVRGVSLYVRGENLLDSEHSTFGIIAPNVRGPDTAPQPFLSPALPFHLRAGIRFDF